MRGETGAILTGLPGRLLLSGCSLSVECQIGIGTKKIYIKRGNCGSWGGKEGWTESLRGCEEHKKTGKH